MHFDRDAALCPAIAPPRPPQVASQSDNVAFCTLLRRLVDEHAPMLDSLAQGLREAKVGREAKLKPGYRNTTAG
jgi:hypothetical protein